MLACISSRSLRAALDSLGSFPGNLRACTAGAAGRDTFTSAYPASCQGFKQKALALGCAEAKTRRRAGKGQRRTIVSSVRSSDRWGSVALGWEDRFAFVKTLLGARDPMSHKDATKKYIKGDRNSTLGNLGTRERGNGPFLE